MSAARICTLLCASASVAFASTAAAEDAAPFVVQLRLPARGASADVFAWRTDRGVEVQSSALASLGVVAPDTDEQVPLSSVAGLSYQEFADQGAIVISCTMACYERQHVSVQTSEAPQATPASAVGAYLNYEVEAQWVEDERPAAYGIAEAVAFGHWGLVESTWVGQAGDTTRFTRLETTWTVDRPADGLRARFGDSVHIGVNGAPVRFGGIQIGRYFGLTPSLITYPTPAISGEAESASTVQLYVDGVLRAQSQVNAGPFVIDNAPVVSGAGETELVITDVLGRQQSITRPFFVSTNLLRRGLSDWSFALGAERRQFGRADARYGDTFAAMRYRFGVTNNLTLEGAIEATHETTTAQAGVTIASVGPGQTYISRAANEDGGFTSASWYYDGRALSLGMQFEQRDGDFMPLGREDDDFRRGVAGNAGFDMGNYGSLSFTGAQVEQDDRPLTRTLTFSYTPDFADGALSLRVAQIQQERSELIAGMSFSFSLTADVSAHASVDTDDRGETYRISAERPVEPGALGWRAQAALGAVERVNAAVIGRNEGGETMAEVAVTEGRGGARLRHAGSVGLIEELPFAGQRIDGAFAVVDAGAPNVSVARNRLDAGETGEDGRRLITNLRPYDDNVISISADDLPIDRAPASPVQRVTAREGAGVIVHFNDARERIQETRVTFADGALPPRGSILVRGRDGERFPIGSEGRVVLQGAEDGDVVELSNTNCEAAADEAAAARGLTLECAALS